MARILACTDGSIHAESIIDHAAWAAVSCWTPPRRGACGRRPVLVFR